MNRLSFVTLLTVACGGGLELEYSDAPVTAPSTARFAANAQYDEGERSVFDVAHFPDADAPTPVVVYIHGGGFTGGDKAELWEGRKDYAEALLDQEIALATCNYRLLGAEGSEGVRTSMTDSARCLQTVRHHAEQLNIDPDRVVMGGISAGAGTALWLATHDDLADAGNEDPVLAESTRILGAVVWETQATYDLVRWNDVFLTFYGLELFATAEAFGLSESLYLFYDIDSADDLETPEIVAYRKDVDMLELMDANDAPIWVRNDVEKSTLPISVGSLFHHPRHAKALHEAALEVGLEAQVYVPEMQIAPEVEQSGVDFTLEKLGL